MLYPVVCVTWRESLTTQYSHINFYPCRVKTWFKGSQNMSTFSAPIAEQIWDMKYRFKDAAGQPIDETVED